jgi:hypothetical protein
MDVSFKFSLEKTFFSMGFSRKKDRIVKKKIRAA